jgi:PAS domain S-box-containing protein
MDGIETAAKIRERATHLARSAPIIFVTAIDTDRERILRAYASGAVDFMQKPLEPAILTAKVGVFAALYRARELARQRTIELETERRTGEEAARRFRLLIESVSDYAIFILDPKGHVSTWNVGAERIKGYTASEIVGKHFSTFYSRAEVAAGKCELELEIAERTGRYEEDGWRIRKDGSRFWASVTITALRNREGVLIGFAKITRDLTERRHNEERLRRIAAENAALEAKANADRAQRIQREFLALAAETLASSLDYRTTLASVARLAVPELADWCSVELVEPGCPRPVQVAVEHADPDKVRYAKELGARYPPDPNAKTGVAEVIRTGKPLLYAELPPGLIEAAARDDEHLRLLRELRLESAIVAPLVGRDRILGALTFVYAGSGRGYTESDLAFVDDFARRAAMAIENSQAHATVKATLDFQEGFVAVLGHDLRNPLSAIDMGAAVLRQRMGNDPATARVLDRMRSSSKRMALMIEQILDLTRSRLGGGLELRPAPLDLCPVLTVIVEELRAAHPSQAIELHCPPAATGTWDRARLEQVFSNLVANAISYGAPEKPVKVQVHLLGEEEVRVTVHNEGEPIPEALLARIFEPFRRGGRDSRTSHTAGVGLGLYISREIVRGHGGEIDVRSDRAEGTTFRVTLPRIAAVPAPLQFGARLM